MYNEKSFTADFCKWLRNKRKQGEFCWTMTFEHKVAKKNRVNFKSDFREHQIPMLEMSQEGCVYHKLSDLDIGRKPFDGVQVCHADAYAVFLWYKPRQPKVFYMINVEDIVKFKKTHKSITEIEAQSIASYTCKLK